MNVTELAEITGGTVLSGRESVGNRISTGYCCDLLSHVMADAPQNCAWMTVLSWRNSLNGRSAQEDGLCM